MPTSNCPRWTPNRLVTGLFRRTTADILDISVAGQLRPNERLRTAHGVITQVTQILPRPTPEPVYNLEVDVEHVYYVTADGVLVHNKYHNHHLIPKYMGGKDIDDNIALFEDKLHIGKPNGFHRQLRAKLREKGLLPEGGKTGSTEKWREFFKQASGNQQEALDALKEAAKEFDDANGTNLLDLIQESIDAGNFD